MSIYYFDQITQAESFLGEKGFALGLMKNRGFPVPDGLILTEAPQGPQEWDDILKWWEKQNFAKLAIRSSAVGEDSTEQSFAGQNSTYLNVTSASELKTAVRNCFQSVHKKSSTLYREHFVKSKSEAKMNVVLQVMVEAKFSGVFFSVDPRTNQKGWIVEAIEGFGEDLVSGKKTPWHFEENKKSSTKLFDLDGLVKTGAEVRDFFNLEIDMEWAINQQDQLQVLQARPITALHGKSEKKRIIEAEIQRLKATHPSDTLWDGNTFAEWSGPPTELTFSIWSKAFAQKNAFSKALSTLGYLGIQEKLPNETHSLLERIFGRAYINISMLAPLYFGPIPYRFEHKKNPKLKFDFHKMTAKTLILTPLTMMRMVKIGFKLSTERHKWVNECKTELIKFSAQSIRVKKTDYYHSFTEDELFSAFKDEVEHFYREHLTWPLVLITLIESTTQSLKALLAGVLSEEETKKKINQWLGMGLHTVTMEMNVAYNEACLNPNKRPLFLEKYGHRGPGELELANPRWSELGESSFLNLAGHRSITGQPEHMGSVEDEIRSLKTYKVQVIQKEWALLREMLELREKWKMSLLSPYSHIRYIALEISKRYRLEDDIFWFSHEEILSKNFNQEISRKRKHASEMNKSISLPSFIELGQLEDILSNKSESSVKSLVGEALSPGLVFGEVRVVTDPDATDTSAWPENTILVAESTDPGWTGLFLKSRAVIVEKGGVLSHCAIVAREMNLPALSGINQCHLKFKDGDKVWVDGNNGRVTLA